MTKTNDFLRMIVVTISLIMITGIGTAYAVSSPSGTDVGSVSSPSDLNKPQVAFTANNVFVSISGSLAREYTPLGVAVQDIDCSSVSPGQFTTGSFFDKDMNFYLTMFGGSTVCKTDLANTVHSSFGSGYSGSTESILQDAAGNFYVGSVDGDADIRKFDSAGTPLAQYDVAIENRGSDWIDLAADQKTMYYTSEGVLVKRYDVSADAQLADFATLPGGPAYALRLLPSGGLLVAATDKIYRLDGTGAVVDSYDVTGTSGWFALNLDSDGTTFWSADFASSMVCRFNIATGGGLDNEDICWSTGTGSGTVFGLSVKGEITVSQCPPGQVGSPPDCRIVGGESLDIDRTALLIAGFQSSAIWMIPVLAGAAGTGAYYIRTRMNKD